VGNDDLSGMRSTDWGVKSVGWADDRKPNITNVEY